MRKVALQTCNSCLMRLSYFFHCYPPPVEVCWRCDRALLRLLRWNFFGRIVPSDSLNRRTSIIFREKKGMFCQYPFWVSFKCYSDFDSKFPGNGRQSNHRTSSVSNLHCTTFKMAPPGSVEANLVPRVFSAFNMAAGEKPRRP